MVNTWLPNQPKWLRSGSDLPRSGQKWLQAGPQTSPRPPKAASHLPKSSQGGPKSNRKSFRRNLRRFRGSPKRPKVAQSGQGTQKSTKFNNYLAHRCLFYTIHILTRAPVLQHACHGNLPGVPMKVCRCESQISTQFYLLYPKLSIHKLFKAKAKLQQQHRLFDLKQMENTTK